MNSYIRLSVEMRMMEDICRNMTAEASSFHPLVNMLQFDTISKEICFIPLHELWKTGLVIKKYIEYPCGTLADFATVFHELNYYLQKASFIANYVDDNIVCDGIIYITNISLESGSISFYSKKLSGKAEEETISYEDYYKRFLPSGLSNQKVKFDMYRLIDDTDLSENISHRQNKNKRIGIVQEIQSLLNRREAVSNSVQAILKWFYILEKLDEKKWGNHWEYIQNIISEKKSSKRDLHILIKLYNKIVQQKV